MKVIRQIVTCILILVIGPLSSQSILTSSQHWSNGLNNDRSATTYDIPPESKGFHVKAVSVKSMPVIPGEDVEISLSEYDGTRWTDFLPLEKDHELLDQSQQIFLPKYLSKATSSIKLRSNSAMEAEINFFGADHISTDSPQSLLVNECFCDTLKFVTRKEWNCPQTTGNYNFAKVTHLIVHHAASTNQSSNWADVVLSIWDFHTRTNGYADIGYNWLIDPNGVLYEGRGGGENAIGAHFCGRNTGTMGVCMLGHLSQVAPTEAALETLEKLLLYKSCQSMIDPVGEGLHNSSGLNLKIVSGHRDGCATECPGNLMYPKLESVRSEIIRMMAACQTTDTEALTLQEEVKVFPNPAMEGIANIRTERTIDQVVVYGSNGQLVRKISGDGNSEVRMDNFSKGFYLVKILFSDGTASVQKLIF